MAYVYDASWKDLLWKYDGQVITYDAIGNPLKYRGMDFAWTNRNQLTQVTKAGVSTTYRYNKDGIRSRKYMADGTVTYQLQGSTITGEQKILTGATNPQYEMEYFYDSAGNLLSMLYNGTEYYYEKNGQGDIIGIVNGQGTEVVTYQYDSWGKVLKVGGDQTIGKRNPFRYRGYYYDEETGLYYLESRYYDPESCRFVNADDEAVLTAEHQNFAQYNLYAYCWNNPVNMSDENGDWPSWATKMLIGTAAIAIGVTATALTGGGAAAVLPAMIGSLKLATAGAAIGSVAGAAKHLVKEKTIKGIGKSMLNGAATGYMVGGLVAGGMQVGRAALTKANSGISLGKNKTVELLYQTPKTKGGTIISIKKKLVKIQKTYRFRLDLDIANGLHFHSGLGKASKVHHTIIPWLF